MSAALHHLALRVRSPERAAEFYTSVLGLPEVKRFPADDGVRSIWIRAGAVVVMLERHLRGAGATSGSGHVLALEVEALAPWEERLLRANVPIDDRSEFTLYVRDPDGHRIGLTVYPRDSMLSPA